MMSLAVFDRRPFALMLVAAFTVAVLAASSAEAKPRLSSPKVSKVGHGVVVKGAGFKKRSVVRLYVGSRGSEPFFVARIRTDGQGRFRTMQRFRAAGDWVWVASGRSGSGPSRPVMVRKPIKVKLGVSIFFEPSLGVTAGTPFYVHGRGWRTGARVLVQARRGNSGRWRNVGRTRATNSSFMFRVLQENRVFNPRTQRGRWQLRACTNGCRVAQAKTRLAEGSFRIGEP